jgi:hypothetical protein
MQVKKMIVYAIDHAVKAMKDSLRPSLVSTHISYQCNPI